MRQYICYLFIPLLVFFAIPTGCDESMLGADSAEAVVFTVPIDVDLFNESALVLVRLWNAAQLEVMARNAKCAITYDPQTQTEKMHCPDGIEYREVTPDEIGFPVNGIVATIEVRSNTINVGEEFRIQISGLYQDKCNTTSAEVSDTAASANIVLEDLEWGTTAKACS